jgi:hypothetical protein
MISIKKIFFQPRHENHCKKKGREAANLRMMSSRRLLVGPSRERS